MGLNRGAFVALVAVTLAGVLLAGCGSSGTATTTVKTVVERVATPPSTTSATTASESPEADEPESEPASTAPPKAKHVGSYIGQRLDVAESDAEEAGVNVKVLGGGTFGVVVPSHWTVCKQEPSPGATGSRVKLIVAREC